MISDAVNVDKIRFFYGCTGELEFSGNKHALEVSQQRRSSATGHNAGMPLVQREDMDAMLSTQFEYFVRKVPQRFAGHFQSLRRKAFVFSAANEDLALSTIASSGVN